MNQQLSIFQPVYDWFKNYLRTADNSTEYLGVGPLMNNQTYCDHFSDILKSLDTGIEEIKLESVDSSALGLPPQILEEIASSIGKNSMVQLVNHAQGEIAPLQIFIISKKTKDNQDNEENNIEDNNLLIQRVQTYRRGLPLGFNNESTGTRRLFELLPIFLSLWNNEPCVWILDEVEREFHTGLTRKILQEFLNSCTEDTRTQVLINTHDLMLMDQDIFRKDEILSVIGKGFHTSSLWANSLAYVMTWICVIVTLKAVSEDCLNSMILLLRRRLRTSIFRQRNSHR